MSSNLKNIYFKFRFKRKTLKVLKLTQYKQILEVVEYENRQEYEYHEFHHIYKNDFPRLQQLLTRLKKIQNFYF